MDVSFNYDPNPGVNVCSRDKMVDGLRDQITEELITYMTNDPTTIKRELNLILIARDLERVADLATNIAEGVVFMVIQTHSPT